MRCGRLGIRVDHVPPHADGGSLASSMPLTAGDHVLLPRADIADRRLPDALEARGASVEAVVAYRTTEAPPGRPVTLLAAALAGRAFEAVVLTSGSTARGLLALAADAGPTDLGDDVRRIPAICIGPETAAAARRLGYTVVAESAAQDVTVLAELVTDIVRRSP